MKYLLSVVVMFMGLLSLNPIQPSQCLPGREYIEMKVADRLAESFNISRSDAQLAVSLAYKFGGDTFPTPVDVLSVMAVESSFKPQAIHKIGPSVGLMQVNVKVHGKEVQHSSVTNVRTGVEILTQYRNRLKTNRQALLAYNLGPTGADKFCKKNPVTCQSAYTKKVEKAKDRILRLV